MLSFDELRSVVEMCTDPARNGFYRSFYKMQPESPALSLASMDEWRALPTPTKDDFLAVPLAERSHIPIAELDHLRASSGTSGKAPLFSPRTHVLHMDYRMQYHDFKNPFLAFTVPLMPHWHARFQKEHGGSPRVIAYDPKHPAASVRLACAAGVDGFSVFIYHVPFLGEEMKKVGMNERIRLAEVTGEICSRAQYDYLRATFPNATIVQSYNSSEVEDAHIGMPCKPMDGSSPLAVYHAKETHYLEIANPVTGEILEPRAGIEGDLLVTAYPGPGASLPLLRYRIGDTVRVVEDSCPHGTWSFTVLGRTEMDFLKVPGGVLRADEVQRVLLLLSDRVTDHFQLRVQTVPGEGAPKLRPVLFVETRGKTDLDALAHDIEEVLRVAPTVTWAQGVAMGRYLPLSCQQISATQAGQKNRRIVLEES